MKKFLFILLALPILWGCEDIEDWAWEMDAKREIKQTLSSYGDYDATQVEALLCDKTWGDDTCVKYDDEWEKITRVIELCGDSNLEGTGSSKYLFHSDGTMTMIIRGSTPETSRREISGEWQFDPETRVLTLTYRRDSGNVDSSSYWVEALGDDTLLWSYTNSQGNYREIYKAKQATN